MTKQEKIKEAYGEYWETVKNYVDESGHCTMYDKSTKVSPNFLELGMSREYVESKIESGLDNDSNLIWRPKSLQEIDHNNGWIKIESESDFPKETITCWFMSQGESFLGHYNSDFNIFVFSSVLFNVNEVTHYQPIQKPKPPIYQ